MPVWRYRLLEENFPHSQLCVTEFPLNFDYEGHFQYWNVSVTIILSRIIFMYMHTHVM